jgi:hypothetical protein
MSRSCAIILGLLVSAAGCTADSSTAPNAEVAPPAPTPAVTDTSATVVVVTTAPKEADHASAVSEELDRARALWSDTGIASYRLNVVENFYSPGCTWTTVVSNGVVTEAETLIVTDTQTELEIAPFSPTGCFAAEWTVEQLHQQIDGMLDSVEEFSSPEFGEHTLDVRFNEVGVPEAVEFDMANGADEETSLQVTFQQLP